MTSTPRRPGPPPVTVRSPADLIAAVPYLLGFHPTDSLVVIGLRAYRLVFAARVDLPRPDAAPAVARYVADIVAEQDADSATVIGYGPAGAVDPVMPEIRAGLADHGLDVMEALRAHEGRFWSYLCDNPDCCPTGGTAYDPAASPVAAAATYAGQVVLADRSALVERVAPVTGDARASMRAATARARARLTDLLDGAATADLLGGRATREAGDRAVSELLGRGPAGGPPGDDEVAWLTLLLNYVPVRDAAWRRVTADDWQLTLWADIVRRAEPELVAAPACLLAFGAWLAGRGALANVALDRALGQEPGYGMARLLRDALDRGLAPAVLDGLWAADEAAADAPPDHLPGGPANRSGTRPAARPGSRSRRVRR